MNARRPIALTLLSSLAICMAAASPAWAKKTVFFSVGDNGYGQLGQPGTVSSYIFRPIPAIRTCETVACGGWTSFALTAADNSGVLYAVGKNNNGQLGLGHTSDMMAFTPIATLWDFTAVAPGAFHTLVIRNGSVWGAGWNDHGELGLGDSTQRNAFTEVPSFGTITAIAAGNRLSLALKNDGTVWGAGWNDSGQLGLGNSTPASTFTQATDLDNVVAIAAGYYHSLALKSSGNVWGAGRNDSGQLGMSDTVNHNVFTQVTGITGTVVAIAAGVSHSLALTDDGKVWVTGGNASGQLGLGDTNNRDVFTQAPGITNVIAIAAHGDHSLALRSDGALWGAGSNGAGPGNNGGLGFGAKITQVNTFTQVPGLTGIRAMASGYNHMFVRAYYGVETTFPSDSGVTFERGKSCNVTWDSINLPPKSAVKIELVKGSGGTWLLSAAAKKMPFKWTVGKGSKTSPADYPDGDDYKIRVSTQTDDDSDSSDNDFAIGSVQGLRIDGSPEIVGGAGPQQYTCTALYTFGDDQDVTPLVKWTCSKLKGVKIGKTGLLTTVPVLEEQRCNITATYGKGKPPVADTMEVTIHP